MTTRYVNMYQTGDGLKDGGVGWESSSEARRVVREHGGALIHRLVVSVTPKPGYCWLGMQVVPVEPTVWSTP